MKTSKFEGENDVQYCNYSYSKILFKKKKIGRRQVFGHISAFHAIFAQPITPIRTPPKTSQPLKLVNPARTPPRTLRLLLGPPKLFNWLIPPKTDQASFFFSGQSGRTPPRTSQSVSCFFFFQPDSSGFLACATLSHCPGAPYTRFKAGGNPRVRGEISGGPLEGHHATGRAQYASRCTGRQ